MSTIALPELQTMPSTETDLHPALELLDFEMPEEIVVEVTLPNGTLDVVLVTEIDPAAIDPTERVVDTFWDAEAKGFPLLLKEVAPLLASNGYQLTTTKWDRISGPEQTLMRGTARRNADIDKAQEVQS